jgi:hypothetical protein
MELARRLLAAGIVSSNDLGRALSLSQQASLPLALALVQAKAVTEVELEAELAHGAGPALQVVQASSELCARLPAGATRRLGAVPLRRDAVSGVVDVAALDPLDAHTARELSFHLGEPVRVLRARFAAMEEELRRLETDGRGGDGRRLRCHTPASPHGAPLSWRPRGSENEAAESDDDDVPAIPLVRRSVPPATATPDDDDVVVPLRSVKPYVPPPSPSSPGGREQRPSIVFDIPPPRDGEPRAGDEDDAGDDARGPGSVGVAAVAAPVGRTLVPPGPLAAPAPTAEGAPRLRDPLTPEERPTTLDAVSLHAEGLVLAPASAGGRPAIGPVDDFPELVAELRRAPSRDAVVERVHRGLGRLARRTAVLAVRRDGLVGWTCNEAFGDLAQFRAVTVPPDEPSLFRTAGTTAVYLGPVPDTAPHEPLLAVMGSASGDVAAVSVRVAGRPVMVLLADELADLLVGTRRMDELARAAGDALTRLLGSR